MRFAVFLAVAVLLDTLRRSSTRSGSRVDEEAEVARATCASMNDVKDTLLHAVSHDLKGPLAGILGAMQTIRRAEQLHLTDDELRRRCYERDRAGGRKMNRLVDDLLDLDRLDRGQLQPAARVRPTSASSRAGSSPTSCPSSTPTRSASRPTPCSSTSIRARSSASIENLL